MRALLLTGLLVALTLAGCASKDTTYVCTTGPAAGKTIDLANVTGSDAKGFDPESACPKPVPPSVVFKTIPAAMTAYFPAKVEWTVLPGTYAEGHSMLTVVAASHHPITSATPTLADYAFQYGKKEHQEVPQTFSTTLTFTEEGARYMRLFANVRGAGLAETPYYSDEVKMTILPVPATGKTVVATQALGDQVGGFKADSTNLQLGDAVVLHNADARGHVFTFAEVPAGFHKPDPMTVAMGGDSPSVLLNIPGSYRITVDDAVVQQVTLSVAAPA